MKILVVGDSYYRADAFRQSLSQLHGRHEFEYINVRVDTSYVAQTESEQRLTEYEGTPEQLIEALTDHEALVVHGAPVSLGVLEASPKLRLVCCARGGPVNVDVRAAEELGIRVVTTPGKNAAAVADLTIALIIMLLRHVEPAIGFLRDGGRLESTFDGAQFFGSELSDMRLGLVGCGHVGSEVCARARGFGMSVVAYDPHLAPAALGELGAEASSLEDLVASCQIVSIHARQTPTNVQLIDEKLLRSFRHSSFLINTAREGLVKESAALQTLRHGGLAGIAADVFEPGGPFAVAAAEGEPGLITLPHIGGATFQSMERAARRIVQEIDAFDESHQGW